MAATSIAAYTPPALTAAIGAGAAKITQTVADVANGNSCVLTGREMILVDNTGASPYTFTVTSTADQIGRTGDIAAYSVPAGEKHLFGPFPLNGWKQSGATPTLLFSASNASVKFTVISLPPTY